MRQPYQRVKPVRDQELRKMWSIAKKPYRCQACHGKPDWPGLAVHHLVRFRRDDSPCNLLLLCRRCHAAQHEDNHAGNAHRLTLGMLLSVKQLEDPGEFDLERLAELYGGPVELEALPGWLCDLRGK